MVGRKFPSPTRGKRFEGRFAGDIHWGERLLGPPVTGANSRRRRNVVALSQATDPGSRSASSVTIRWMGAAVILCATGLSDARSQSAVGTDPCLDSKTDQDLRTCRRNALNASQAQLDRTVEALHSTLQKDQPVKTRLLEEAQESWTRFRDAECRLVTVDSASGTAADLYIASCLTELNGQRSRDLDRMGTLP